MLYVLRGIDIELLAKAAGEIGLVVETYHVHDLGYISVAIPEQ